jgi:FAD/FMN-containing dehydrogenase
VLGLLAAGAVVGLDACTSGGSGSDTPTSTGPTTSGPTTGTASSTATPSSSAAPTATDGDWEGLRVALQGNLVRPPDRGYDAARLLFNRRFDGQRPSGVAQVASDADVASCLSFARTHGVAVSVRSGGHSYLGASAGPGLVLDLRRLRQVSVGAGTATIGTGAALVDVYSSLAARGVSVPAGSCPGVGLGGLTLGGGMGVVARRYGLTCDRLTSARVVLPDGRAVTASADTEPDLFWALRGGGGSFGVVTSMTLTTHRTRDLATFSVGWPWAVAADVLAGWQTTLADAPDELWTTCHLLSTTGSAPTVQVAGVLVGAASRLSSQVAALVRAVGATPTSRSVRTRGYLDTMLLEAGCLGSTQTACHVQDTTPGGALPRDAFVAGSDVFDRALPDSAVARVVAAVQHRQDVGLGVGGVGFDSWGGAVGRVPATATAFPHRSTLLSAQWTASWADVAGNGPLARNQASLADLRGSTRGLGTGCYSNYADATLADAPQAYWGANLPRLQQVKRSYDPTGLLDQPQGVRG